jgi:uncharacterized OB-fold protein
MSRPIPVPDLHTAPFWEHVREGRFALPHCESCARHHFYPKGACPHCGSSRITWSEASGRGEVYSFSVVHRPPGPAFKEDVPYVIAIVKTEEGPHLLSRIVDVPPEAVSVGMKVKVRLLKVSDETSLPVFSPG